MDFWDACWGDKEKVDYTEFIVFVYKYYSLERDDVYWLCGSGTTCKNLDEERFLKFLRSSGGLYIKVEEGADVDYMYRSYFEWTCKYIQLNDETISMFRGAIMPSNKKGFILLRLLFLAIGIAALIIFAIKDTNIINGGKAIGWVIGIILVIVFSVIPKFLISRRDGKNIKKVKNDLINRV